MWDGSLNKNETFDIFSTFCSKEIRTEKVKELFWLELFNLFLATHVERLIAKYSDVFHISSDKLEYTSVMKHTIPTVDKNPIHTKQYRFPAIHKEKIDKQIKALLEDDVIKFSNSPYNSPLWIVPKKADSKDNKRWRNRLPRT